MSATVRLPAAIPACGHAHRTYAARAVCAWRSGRRPVLTRADVYGEGPHGAYHQNVIPGSPAFYGQLTLFATAEARDARLAELRSIHEHGRCSGTCIRNFGEVSFK